MLATHGFDTIGLADGQSLLTSLGSGLMLGTERGGSSAARQQARASLACGILVCLSWDLTSPRCSTATMRHSLAHSRPVRKCCKPATWQRPLRWRRFGLAGVAPRNAVFRPVVLRLRRRLTR